MRPLPCLTLALAVAGFSRLAAAPEAAPTVTPDRALTIYNQNFAVVRQSVPLDLQAGLNRVTVSDITYHLEPDSVVLRDPSGKRVLQIREQNYRADPVTQELLLSLYEGKTIDFQVTEGDHTRIVSGKIIRAGTVASPDSVIIQDDQTSPDTAASNQPIIEVNGKLQFTLPGTPLFPALPDDSILKPALTWTLQTDAPGPVNAELAYITDGLTWKADYNVVAPESGDTLELTGWVTMQNDSGKTFDNARIKLMAGDVSKITPVPKPYAVTYSSAGIDQDGAASPPVTEKAFDDYHLYTLANPTTLRDRETKQVEFSRASRIASKVTYVYDGLKLGENEDNGQNYENIRGQPDYGTESTTKVAAMREFVNSEANGLGIPLPKGRMRFYRRDTDGQLEFIGENVIDHTPKDETVRVFTGNAFDITGSRTQTNYKIDTDKNFADESFAITLRNHKPVPIDVHVVEHLYRALTWTITAKTDKFVKTDAHTIEFVITLAPNEDKTLHYTAHYTW